ncbi:hypothetical protein HYW36_01285 [Candidatus Saccharibacteria bacterium]|nr:hypothetical protein [Candidatus Saccharibacteria bacterium]
MALFNLENNLKPDDKPVVKRGRGRPRKNPIPGQGLQASTDIVQSSSKISQKIRLGYNKKTNYALALLILAVVPTLYFYSQNKNTEKKLNELQQKAQNSDNVSVVVEQVGRLVLLPTDEQPTLATVSDLSKLQGQPFFASAAKGDKVLVYNKAKKAILYRPSLNKIVEMAPLNLSEQSSQ